MNLKNTPVVMTRSGRYVSLTNPVSEGFCIEDIAHSLANICRFSGHVSSFYSVAQHCVLASHLVSQDTQLSVLLHDSQEAYLGYVMSPLKDLLPDYHKIELKMAEAIFKKFGINWPQPSAVEKADLIMLATERRDLMVKDDNIEWAIIAGVQPARFRIIPQTPERAKRSFLERFYSLYDEKVCVAC